MLLNRRGWSNFLSCRSCGRVWSCPECDVALVLHRAGGYVACHHCGHRERAPDALPRLRLDLGRSPRRRHRAPRSTSSPRCSTTASFPVFRLDADVLGGAAPRGPSRADASLGASCSGSRPRSGVLIGTQMVAKGHDFPDVTLGVVLDADATLRFPDFRAEERTFALIAQLAGRAGRGGDGRVLVQTIAPEARAIVHAADHDSDGFLPGELERRRALALPALRAPDQDRLLAPSRRRRARGGAARARELLEARCRAAGARGQAGLEPASCSGPRRCFACAGASARCSSSRPRERASRGRGGRRRPSSRSPRERAHAGVSFSVDVDPQ